MLARFQNQWKAFFSDWLMLIVNFVKNQSISTESDNLRKWVLREVKQLWTDKVNRIANIEGAYKVVEGAYKDVPIPYLTLLYPTLPNSTFTESDTPSVDSKAVQSGKSDLLWKFTIAISDQKIKEGCEAKDFPARKIHWSASVNDVIKAIRDKVEWYWLVYDWGMDRNFASHVNSKKLLAEAEKYQCKSWLEYILYVIDASTQSDFRIGKICWPKSAYQQRAKVLNDFLAKQSKEKEQATIRYDVF